MPETPDEAFAALDGQLSKLADTPEGLVKAEYLGADVRRLAQLYAADATRPQAETMLKVWSEDGDPLRKAIASHWLSRARATLMNGGAMPTGKEAAVAAAAAKARPRHPAFMKRSERKNAMAGAHQPVTT